MHAGGLRSAAELIRILLASRMVVAWLGAILVGAVLMWMLTGVVIPIELSWERPRVLMADSVLLAIVLGTVGAQLLRPRMWEWDRIGTWRSSSVAAMTATVGILVPAALVLLTDMRWQAKIERDASYLSSEIQWVAADGLFLIALVWTIAPYAGSLVAGAASLAVYAAAGMVNHLAPAWHSVLPLAGNAYESPRWIPAVTLFVLAICIHGWTRGATQLSRRVFHDVH